MTLYARPTRREHEIHPKTKHLIKIYMGICKLAGNGSGFNIRENSNMYMYLAGAEAALELLSGSGIEQLESFKKDLITITSMVRQNREVVLEEND